ncbi:hypothetical protein AMECASPLE_010333 [Ameca splendens]|uniref:Uncharacterized protein n=1 Tax=Ameca splendens TaxID=208324 RepID=A0ABV0ZAK6_9TELE
MISHVMSNDYGECGSSHCFVMDPHPPSSSSARKNILLPPALMAPFPSSQFLSTCLHPGYRHCVTRPGFCSGFSSNLLPLPRLRRLLLLWPSYNLPASFISSMDSLQRSISSLTQLLRLFDSNSATSALPLLCSPDV